MLGVPRLDRAHERFWLAVKWERKRVSIRDRRKKEMDAPPNSIPCVVLKVHGDLRARLRVDSLAECVVREEVRDDRVQELCGKVHPRAVTAGNQNHAHKMENPDAPTPKAKCVVSLRHGRLVVLEPVWVERVVVWVDVLVRVHVMRDREHERAFRDLVRFS